MRKPIQWILIAGIVVLGGTAAWLYSTNQKTNKQLAEVTAAEESARNRYANTIDAIAEIQDSLNAIALGDASVQMKGDSEQGISAPSGQDALDRIATLRASIVRSKERIRQLESSLKASGIKASGLQRMVANLKTSVAQKEQLVAELSGRVDTLTTQVAGLQTEVQQNVQTIEEKRREIATVYVAVGNKKDLTESGIVEAKGGVLGIGKTLKPTGQFNEMDFRAVDTDQQTVVSIPAEKAIVVSAQPPSSYELRPVEGGLELHILQPDEFRKVKQLVIVTA